MSKKCYCLSLTFHFYSFLFQSKTKKEWEPPKIPPSEFTNSKKDNAKCEDNAKCGDTAIIVPSEGLGSNPSQSITTLEANELQSSFDFMLNGEPLILFTK